MRREMFLIGAGVVLLLAGADPARGGLTHEWTFDEASGATAVDAGTPQLDGTISAAGVTIGQPGKIGAAYQFTAAQSGQVYMPADPSLSTEAGTWSLWVNTSTVGGAGGHDAMLLDRRDPNGNVLTLDVNGHIFTQATAGGVTYSFAGTTNVADGQWHHVALVWNTLASTPQTMYVDGNVEATGNAGWAWGFTSTRNLELGCSHDVWWNKYNGLMDDVSLWSDQLIPGKIRGMNTILAVNGSALSDYNAGKMEQLFQVYDGTLPTANLGLVAWSKATGLTGHAAGDAWYDNGRYYVQFGADDGVTGTLVSAFAWSGGGANGKWKTGMNWQSGSSPAPSATLIFAGVTNTNTVNDFDSGTQFNGLLFDSTAGSFTLGGNGIKLAGDVRSASAAPQTIDLPLVLAGMTTITVGEGGLTISRPISEDTGGPFGITKSGAGTLVLSAANSFSGPLIIGGGTVLASGPNQLGSGNSVTLNGGTLQFAASFDPTSGHGLAVGAGGGTLDTNGHDVTVSGTIDGAGGLKKSGDGVLALVNAGNAYSGGTTIVGGTLQVSEDAHLGASTGNVVLSGGTLRLAGPSFASSRSVTVNSGTIDVPGSAALDGPISGVLTKTGGGTLVVSNAGNRLSATTVSGGTLQAPAAALASSIALENNAKLALDGAGAYYSGISGAGSVSKINDGELLLGGVNSYTGPTTIHAGTLTLVPPSASAVVHLAMEETEGATALNSANAALNGTISAAGVTVGQPGKIGAAYQFSAVDNGQVVVPADPSLNTMTGTWAMWVNTSLPLAGAGGEAAILFDRRAGAGNILGINGAGQLETQATWQGGSVSFFFVGGVNVADGQWHHVALTWNTAANSVQTFYVDGQPDGAAIANHDWGFDNRELEIGSSYDAWWYKYNGLMDDVQVFNRALSAGEMQQLYSMGPGDVVPDTSAVTVAQDATFNVNGLKETIGPLSGEGHVGLGGGTLTVNSSDGANGVNSTFSGDISGESGGLVKIGAGRLVLSGPNTYTGGTTVAAGTLEIAAADALPAGGRLTIGAEGGAAVSAVPEPGTMSLLIIAGIAAVAGLIVRRRKA
jgi:fibronectin-binding autotransporter adhesin